jgi:hypothetical protein
MVIRGEIIDALEELESGLADEAGETLKLILPSGGELPCVPSMEETGTEIVVGRQAEVILRTVLVRKAHFIDASNTIITADSDIILADNQTGRARAGGVGYGVTGFRGKTYRVLRVLEDSSGAYFRINLGSAKG